jgi:site-specific DNA-methyltransferase (adenine-specific)
MAQRKRDETRNDGDPGGDNPRNRGAQQRANHHPTVKPLDLMRYLVRLVTRKGGTVLDPFMGSGTTGWAARLEGCDFVGIDREPEYVEIARGRIAGHAPLFDEPTAAPVDDDRQLTLGGE